MDRSCHQEEERLGRQRIAASGADPKHRLSPGGKPSLQKALLSILRKNTILTSFADLIPNTLDKTVLDQRFKTVN